MSVRQSKIDEIRYLKRKNLEQEAKIVGNMYRDLIRSHGIDCKYYKLNTNKYEVFKNVIDENTLLYHAYGYDHSPDYTISADMITYMEVENDIFQLNKYGLNPNMDVNFCFDSIDFATALATKLGQYKEYKIDEKEFTCEVPELTNEKVYIYDPVTSTPIGTEYLSANVFPYEIGLGTAETYTCDMLSGKIKATITDYEVGVEQTVQCVPYEHTDFNVEFDVNENIYKSFKYKINTDDFLEQLIFLTYTVNKIKVGTQKVNLKLDQKVNNIFTAKAALCKILNYIQDTNLSIPVQITDIENCKTIPELLNIIRKFQIFYNLSDSSTTATSLRQIGTFINKIIAEAKKTPVIKDKYKYILHGKIHGAILFYDINKISSYTALIHPEVGDLISIDFPDENNREQYEITDCFDKQLTSDGISPLLHKYIWKCKARRYTNTYENMEENTANEIMLQKQNDNIFAAQMVTEKISMYKNNEDAVYGGYGITEKVPTKVDAPTHTSEHKYTEYEYLDDNTLIDIMKFNCGSKLCTNGYDLIFVTKDEKYYSIATDYNKHNGITEKIFESGLKWLKASDTYITFVNISGESYKLVEDANATTEELEMCLNQLFDSTVDTNNINNDLDNFIKFTGTRSVIWATPDHLYAKLASKQLNRII